MWSLRLWPCKCVSWETKRTSVIKCLITARLIFTFSSIRAWNNVMWFLLGIAIVNSFEYHILLRPFRELACTSPPLLVLLLMYMTGFISFTSPADGNTTPPPIVATNFYDYDCVSLGFILCCDNQHWYFLILRASTSTSNVTTQGSEKILSFKTSTNAYCASAPFLQK